MGRVGAMFCQPNNINQIHNVVASRTTPFFALTYTN